ncbi:MAG: peroxisomal multifunctional enzyme type 2-like [Brevundimonas sp.]|nr:peroxisomal multifunctional enzyme type 2-like [Brevundimonas sp.]
MPISYPDVLDVRTTVEVKWKDRDTMLYALGLGLGDNPMDKAELALVSEFQGGLKAVPTMAAILSSQASPVRLTGMNYLLAVHGEQSIRIHRPLPTKGRAIAEGRITQVFDKGEGKGAVILSETSITDAETGELIATAGSTAFARGDGGFGGPRDGAPVPHPMPDRAPDVTLDFQTRPGQALLYRLSGDYNPLHADPDVALKAGFDRPILHGLCTYGITGRAVLKAFCDQDPTRLVAHSARFSAPVMPSDIISVDLWRDGDVVSFEARVAERGVTVIKNGRAELG